jgi:hypothetical protein
MEGRTMGRWADLFNSEPDEPEPPKIDMPAAFGTDFRQLTDMKDLDGTLTEIKKVRATIADLPCPKHPDHKIVAVGKVSGALCDVCLVERVDMPEEAHRVQ